MSLRFESVDFAYEERTVLRDVSIDAPRGDVVGILGSNGAGKTTLLRLASGAISPSRGTVTVDGRPVRDYPAKERARRVAMMGQSTEVPRGLRVRDVVELGRFPHRPRFSFLRDSDRRAVEAAMAACEIEDLATRYVETLSGGEYRRVLLAMTLAQGAPVVLLDEPFAHLDPAHVVLLVQTVLRMERGARVLLVAAHDVNAVLRIATRLVVLARQTALPFESVAAAVARGAFQEAFGSCVDVEETRSGVWVQPRFGDVG